VLEKLKPVAANGSMIVYVEVPAGFSEAKRMGFYRALAVRNLLIQLNVPTGSIDVSVVEGTMDANASVVMVRSR
jgi:ABC-type phosphonate transport system ATPase subunit